MIHIDVSELYKSFGGQSVLRGLSFSVMAGEHVGLVGANGTGKTTLLKILTGTETPDQGSVSMPSGLRVGLLHQLPVYPPGTSAMDVLRQAFDRFYQTEAQLRQMERELAEGHDPALLKRYGELSHQFEVTGGFETEVELARVCNGLMLSDDLLKRPIDRLSGGEQTRVNLARLLLERTDLLLLDEPTNHLDLRACEWLEEYLDGFKGTVMTVSHDRYFLDHFAKRIIDLVDGKADFYAGNYSFYAGEREARRIEQQRLYDKEQAAYQKLSSAATQMHAWAGKNAKLHRRAFSMEKRAARILRTQKPVTKRRMSAGFQASDFEADDIFRLQGLAKAFGTRTLFDDLTLTMRAGERVALLGDNGTGKSTLLKILTGELKPDAGRVWQGPAIKPGYLPQIISFDHPERSLVDTLLYSMDITPGEARNRLASFQFVGDKVFDPVSALSGGERSRLMLCLLMARNTNLLLLDEPTNHLDIDARAWIEDALDDFTQAMLFVSHDRYFIEQFATRIWWLENGTIWNFPGNYHAFREALRAGESPAAAKAASGTKAALLREAAPAPAASDFERPSQAAKSKGSPLAQRRRLEQAELKLEKEIAELEASLLALEPRLVEAASDFTLLCELLGEQERLQVQREDCYARYETLLEENDE